MATAHKQLLQALGLTMSLCKRSPAIIPVVAYFLSTRQRFAQAMQISPRETYQGV